MFNDFTLSADLTQEGEVNHFEMYLYGEILNICFGILLLCEISERHIEPFVTWCVGELP